MFDYLKATFEWVVCYSWKKLRARTLLKSIFCTWFLGSADSANDVMRCYAVRRSVGQSFGVLIFFFCPFKIMGNCFHGFVPSMFNDFSRLCFCLFLYPPTPVKNHGPHLAGGIKRTNMSMFNYENGMVTANDMALFEKTVAPKSIGSWYSQRTYDIAIKLASFPRPIARNWKPGLPEMASPIAMKRLLNLSEPQRFPFLERGMGPPLRIPTYPGISWHIRCPKMAIVIQFEKKDKSRCIWTW